MHVKLVMLKIYFAVIGWGVLSLVDIFAKNAFVLKLIINLI